MFRPLRDSSELSWDWLYFDPMCQRWEEWQASVSFSSLLGRGSWSILLSPTGWSSHLCWCQANLHWKGCILPKDHMLLSDWDLLASPLVCFQTIEFRLQLAGTLYLHPKSKLCNIVQSLYFLHRVVCTKKGRNLAMFTSVKHWSPIFPRTTGVRMTIQFIARNMTLITGYEIGRASYPVMSNNS